MGHPNHRRQRGETEAQDHRGQSLAAFPACDLGGIPQRVSTGSQTHRWRRESSPGAGGVPEAGACRAFPGASPCCVFPASCEKTNKSLAGMAPAGPGRGFALAQRKSSFPIFWRLMFWGGGGSRGRRTSPQPRHGSAFAVPGPSVASSEPNRRVHVRLSAYLWHACPACAGHARDAFTESFLSRAGFFLGWVPPAPLDPPDPGLGSTWIQGGPSRTPSAGARARLSWPERVFHADPAGSRRFLSETPQITPNFSPPAQQPLGEPLSRQSRSPRPLPPSSLPPVPPPQPQRA